MDTPQQSDAGSGRPSPASSPAASPPDERAPLTFTFFTKDSGTVTYSEKTADATLDLLRADILEGLYPRQAKITITTRTPDGKATTIEGTLLKCALNYPKLADLYMPVRRRANRGLALGILLGLFVFLVVLGFTLFMQSDNSKDDTWGEMILAFPGVLILPFLSVPAQENQLMTRGMQVACAVGLVFVYTLLFINMAIENGGSGESNLLCLALLALPACGGILCLFPRDKLNPLMLFVLRAIRFACGAALFLIPFPWARSPWPLGRSSELHGEAAFFLARPEWPSVPPWARRAAPPCRARPMRLRSTRHSASCCRCWPVRLCTWEACCWPAISSRPTPATFDSESAAESAPSSIRSCGRATGSKIIFSLLFVISFGIYTRGNYG